MCDGISLDQLYINEFKMSADIHKTTICVIIAQRSSLVTDNCYLRGGIILDLTSVYNRFLRESAPPKHHVIKKTLTPHGIKWEK